MGICKKKPVKRRLLWGLAIATALYAGTAAYFRYRPQKQGVNGGARRRYRVRSENIKFFHDTCWFDGEQRHRVGEITPALIQQIERARRFIVMDIFLFSHHHLDTVDDFIPTTSHIVNALSERKCPAWFITDPINSTYGTAVSAPIRWLQHAGVNVCFTNLRKLRDSTLLYAPLWRLTLRWIRNTAPPRINNPIERGTQTTPWAILEAVNVRANHRKLAIADDGNSYSTLVTSANFEDASSYYCNTALVVKDDAVARHFLQAEKALASMSGCDIPLDIPEGEGDSCADAEVEPLMGMQIKAAILEDLNQASRGDTLHLFSLMLSDRDVIDALIRASARGVRGTLVLDQSRISFGNPKNGFPNQITGLELFRKTDFEVRWANSGRYEYHNKFILLQKPSSNIVYVGSANFNRRSLTDTVLENNLRVQAPPEAALCETVRSYAQWMAAAPRSIRFEQGSDRPGALKYWLYRLQETTGSGSF